MNAHPPFSHSFDLPSLGDAEKTIEFAPSAPECAAIAAWAGIDALDAFSAAVRLRREGPDTYHYEGSFHADVTQSCVVTLVPALSHLEGTVSRDYRVVAQRGRRRAPDTDAEDAGEDIETLTSGVIDLAVPVLEEFVLAIDPYPRAPGAKFEAPTDSDKPANPFVVLEKLKREP